MEIPALIVEPLSFLDVPPANQSWTVYNPGDPQSRGAPTTDDYEFEEASHSGRVLNGLNELRIAGQYCDVTLCANAAEFPCHRLVLAASSRYFQAMFASDLSESRQERVSINGVDADTLQSLVTYAYTAQILITQGTVQALLSAANLLEMLPVRDACCGFLDRAMDEANCLGIHVFAETHACAELQEKAKDFALTHFTEVSRQEELLSLSADKLVELVADDALIAPEEAVFSAALSWLDHDRARREDDFPRVLENVRLPLLSPYYLHDRVAATDIVRRSPRCRELLEEAQTYHLLLDRRPELQTTRTRPRRASETVEVVVAVGGEDEKVVLRSVETLDPCSLDWRTLACLPFAVSKHGLVVSGSNHLYMAGGEFPDGSASRSMWRYDPCLDHWLEICPMNVPRSELGLAMLDGCIYAVGGWEGSSRLDSVERYDLSTNEWSFVAPLGIAVTSPAVVALGGLLYVTGGAVLEDGDGIELVQSYDPQADHWTQRSPMLIPRSGSAACVVAGYIYVIGGWHASTENTNKVERYDPRTDSWEQRAPLVERRYRPGVAVVGGRVYVCGGEEGWDRYHDTIERYDPEVDTWEIIGEMATSRSWLSCVAMTIHKHILPQPRLQSACIV